MNADINNRVKTLISQQVGMPLEDIHDASTFESLEFDSLDEVELVMTAEEEFEIVIDDNDLPPIKTVEQFCKHIEALNAA